MQSDKEKLERVLEILPEDVLNYIHDSLTSSHELERKAWERLDQLRIHAGKISSKFSNAKIQSGFELMTKNLEVLNVCLNDQLALVNPKASLDHFGVQKHPKTSKDFDTVYKDIYEKSSSFKRSFEDFLETAFSESLDTKKSVKNVTNSVITLTDTGDIYKGASYIMGPSKVSMEYLFVRSLHELTSGGGFAKYENIYAQMERLGQVYGKILADKTVEKQAKTINNIRERLYRKIDKWTPVHKELFEVSDGGITFNNKT